MRTVEIVITCEHAGNKVPNAYRYLFDGKEALLNSHKGWDPGALHLARHMSKVLKSNLFYTNITRLLVDCNRSAYNPEIFSEVSSPLKKPIKKYLLQQYYYPYRDKVIKCIKTKTNDYNNKIIHLSVHSFTPQLHGQERMVDVGLLFDEARKDEALFSSHWKTALEQLLPNMIIMLNCPYNGADDGFTSYMREKIPEDKYLGIEIEVNQKYANSTQLDGIKSALSQSFVDVNNTLLNKITLSPQNCQSYF